MNCCFKHDRSVGSKSIGVIGELGLVGLSESLLFSLMLLTPLSGELDMTSSRQHSGGLEKGFGFLFSFSFLISLKLRRLSTFDLLL